MKREEKKGEVEGGREGGREGELLKLKGRMNDATLQLTFPSSHATKPLQWWKTSESSITTSNTQTHNNKTIPPPIPTPNPRGLSLLFLS
jgi:hypothetical protein